MIYCLTYRCDWIHMPCWYVCLAVYITKFECKVAGIQQTPGLLYLLHSAAVMPKIHSLCHRNISGGSCSQMRETDFLSYYFCPLESIG